MRILGVDGFAVVREGFTAALDLLLDVSTQNLTVEEAAAKAEAFVHSKDRPDLLWEVWTELASGSFPPVAHVGLQLRGCQI